MMLKMFSVYDIKSESYMTPFFFPAVGQAVRAFKDLVADKRSTIGMHPEDYKLVHIADFDDSNCEIVPTGVVSLGFGTDYVEKSDVPPGLRGVA